MMVKKLLITAVCTTLLAGMVNAQAAPDSEGNDVIRVMPTSFDNMRELTPGVYMKHIYGDDTSIGLFRFVKQDEPFAVPRHSHGQEIGYVIKGKVTINGVTAGPGDVIIIPAGVEHDAGAIDFEGGDEFVMLSIISPARDYGPEEGGGKFWQEEESGD